MAQNIYPAQWQQGQPVQETYNNGNRRPEWTDNEQIPSQYKQQNRRPQASNFGSSTYMNHSEPSLQQDGQWVEPYQQRPFEEDQSGYGSSGEIRRSGRSYQYDERFHNQYPPRSHQDPRHPSGHGQRREERHRLPEKNLEKRGKPRERILAAPVSPKEISWDNPFPTFNLKKKEHKKVSSLDKGLSKLDLHTARLGEQRPNTSQSHRRRDESRPHTSHAQHQHPTDFHSLPNPRFPSNPPMSPLWKSPLSERTSQQSSQAPSASEIPPNRPGANPLHPRSLENPMSPSFQHDGSTQASRIPIRSMTAPEETASMNMQNVNRVAPLPQPLHRTLPNQQSVEPGNGQYREQYDDRHADLVPTQRSRSHEVHLPPAPNYRVNQMQMAHPGSYGQPIYQQQGRYTTDSSTLDQPGLPDFDAIPHSPNERFEEAHPSPQPNPTHERATYQKRHYQASGPLQPHLDMQRVRATAGTNRDGSPLADFAFDLPTNALPSAPVGGSSWGASRRRAYLDLSEERAADSRQYSPLPNPNHSAAQAVPGDSARFPPRTVSRQTAQPRSASDADQYPLPYARGYQSGQENMPSVRPGISQGMGPSTQRFETPLLPQGLPQNRDNMYHVSESSSRQYNGVQSPQNLQNEYSQYSQNPFEAEEAPRPRTSSSARPPPVRHYGGRTSADFQRPNGSGQQKSPDSLPAHPIPIRPGLVNANHGSGLVPAPNPTSNMQIQRRDPSDQTRNVEDERTESSVTKSELSALQQAVKNNPSDYATSLVLAKKLVEAASSLSNEGGIVDAKTTTKNREKYIFDAHKLVKKLVNAGYPNAMFYLADCHGQGLLGLAPDPKEAFALYQSAAKLNHPPSAYRVAVCCEMGQDEGGGTRRDPLKAMQWYKRAATLGDTPAMYKMGMILLKGLLGQPKNPREALSWLKRAAERADSENPHALHELGLLYESAQPNDSIIRDEKYALQLFKQAGELGYKYSQFRLGSAFEYGLLGCMIDARQSIGWYTRAAAQGEHQSELALSGWYLTGSEGILQQSDTEAYLWARKAASSGLAKAEYAMGYFTEVGIGVSANLEEAKRWYYRAAAQNYPKARERLEDLKRGGQKMQKTRVSRSAVGRQNEGDCVVM